MLAHFEYYGIFIVVRFIALFRSENKSPTSNEWFPYYEPDLHQI